LILQPQQASSVMPQRFLSWSRGYLILVTTRGNTVQKIR